MSKLTIGLALGGGGARGAAHIGVLQVLHQNHIPINRIVGTSAGAVIGAMYAATVDPHWVESRFREFVVSEPFINLGTDRMLKDRDPHSPFGQLAKRVRDQIVIVTSLNRTSIIKKERLKVAFEFLIPVQSFEELKIPLEVVATDLQTGENQIYFSGDLIEAVVQSGSIPGYVEPTIYNNKIIVDGGVSLPIPVPLLKDKVDFTIAIDIKKQIFPDLKELNIYEILQRSEQVTNSTLAGRIVETADFIIRPDVMNLHWSQFEKFDELLKNGFVAAEEVIGALKEAIRQKTSWTYRLRQRFGFV